MNSSDDLDDVDDNNDDQDDEEAKKKKKTKIYYGKKPKPPVDEELMGDPTQLPPVPSIPVDPLDKNKRHPAQERIVKELNAINERIVSLTQLRQMDLITADNRKQLKQLMSDRKKKAFELRRLQQRQRASNKYRVKQRKIVKDKFFFSHFYFLFFS